MSEAARKDYFFIPPSRDAVWSRTPPSERGFYWVLPEATTLRASAEIVHYDPEFDRGDDSGLVDDRQNGRVADDRTRRNLVLVARSIGTASVHVSATKPESGWPLRLALIAAGSIGAVVVSEGAYSLTTGNSLFSTLLDRRMGSFGTLGTDLTPRARGRPDDDAPAPTSATNDSGPWAIHADPDVGMTMRPNTVRTIVGATTTTDPWGQRVRLGTQPLIGATRIAIVGDSVAFGYGVGDHQTFAHNLEQLLATVARGAGPPPAVFTVACPGWNTRNEVCFLLDHLGRLKPDVVILMPVENDLDDQYRINEAGVRGVAFDPSLAPDRPHICGEHWVRLYKLAAERMPLAESLRLSATGHIRNSAGYVAETRLTPESVRRWDDVGNLLEELRERLELHDAHLMVALRSQNPFESMFDALVRERSPSVPTRAFFEEYGPDDSLDTDSHPNPGYTRASAWCLADELLTQGWIPDANRTALPSIAPRFQRRLATRRSDDELAVEIASLQALWDEFLGPEIDFENGRGFHQVYGGLEAECAVGRHVMFALRSNGEARMALRILRLPSKSRMYPLTLAASFNGVATDAVTVPAPAGPDEALELTFDIPAVVRDAPLIDVRIDSSSWTILNARPKHLEQTGPTVGLVVQRRLAPVSYYFVGARLLR